jgi:hypothetical protein
MAFIIEARTQTNATSLRRRPQEHPSLRLEGEFRDAVPASVFVGGIRLKCTCYAKVVMASGGSSGSAPTRLAMDIDGIVTAPSGEPMPTPKVVASAGLDFPDVDYRLTGTAFVQAVDSVRAELHHATLQIKGWVNLESGELEVEARPL